MTETKQGKECSLFSYGQIRIGQQEFYADATEAALDGKILLANAPTGVGKTAAALSAALAAAIPNNRKVVFLTTRNSHHLQALFEARKINESHGKEIEMLKGFPGERALKVIDKVSKPKMCLFSPKNGLVRCDYAKCKYSKPPNNEVANLLVAPLSAAQVQELGKAKQFCAHNATLAAMEGADLIICDYSYIFDPEILDLFMSKAKCTLANMDLIIDEAHNLSERIRGMNEQIIDDLILKNAIAGLSEAMIIARKTDFLLADDAASLIAYLKGTFIPNIKSLAKKLNPGDERPVGPGWLQSLSPDFGLGAFVSADQLGKSEKLSLQLARQYATLRTEYLNVKDGEEPDIESMMALHRLAQFIDSAEKAGSQGAKHGVFFKLESDGNYVMKAMLYDPASAAESVFSQAHSAILMSGTLIGKETMADMLGIGKGRIIRLEKESYSSPFDEARAPVSIITGASSRFIGRSDPEKMRDMASAIEKAAESCHPSSFAVYYPSYEYMELVLKALNLPKFSHEIELKGMGHYESEEMMRRIERKTQDGQSVAMHAVLGGSYSEGVDFKENPFKPIIIAGYPFPKPTAFQIAYEKYLERKFDSKAKAQDCASLLPAAIKTVQAIGRGIRSQSDWCYILLIDDRFQQYARFFPTGIRKRMQIQTEKEAETEIRKFVKKMNGN